MMLAALNEFARERKLTDDPLYEEKPVDFLLRISGEGRFIGMEPTQGEDGKGKKLAIPRIPQRSVNIAAGFFVDNPKYVLGFDKEAGAAKGGKDKRAARLAAFLEQVQAVVAEKTTPEARAVEAFLQSEKERGRALAWQDADKWTGSELIAFVVGDATSLVHELPGIRAHWERRASEQRAQGCTAVCLVTGREATVARTHLKLKNVPNAQSSGASLVSFNAKAFESHGLEQGDNAPISEDAALGYAMALNNMLEKTPQRRHQQGVSLGDDSVLVFWTRGAPQAEGWCLSLVDPSEKDLERFAESPFNGVEPAELKDPSAFYGMVLAGNAGRVVVRTWFTSTVGEVKGNVMRYFDDLRIGSAPARPTPIWRLLKAVETPAGRGLAPAVAGRMAEAALLGRPFPRQLLFAALDRLQLPPSKPELEREQLRLRAALIKAYLLRDPTQPKPLEVTVSLDKNNRAQPYVLGRLFAVLERLQSTALGDVNATIRDRYFGAASRNPAMVFPRLMQLSVHHASKAAEQGRWLERVKSEVVGLLPSEKSFPSILKLEDQGLFAVGYYHQREDFFTKRAPSEGGAPPAASTTSND
ncbi:type I-C CRISPR-associated protein Cas8c/Csd1 [Myxococcaceae bacterium GXIMD 01537]